MGIFGVVIMRCNLDALFSILIPEFDEQGLLPEGLYDTSLLEIRQALSFTPRRTDLIHGLERYARIWDESGFLAHFVIDGSFVTSKPEPGDIDMILVPRETALLSMQYYDMLNHYVSDRHFTRQRFGCEVFGVTGRAELNAWIDFFGASIEGRPRGLLRLRFPL